MRPLPDMTSHILALEALLTEAGWSVHVGDVLERDPALPYVMIQARPGTGLAVNLASDQVETDEAVNVTVVSDTPLNCLHEVAAVRRVLHGAVLDVLGRACFPLRLDDSQPVLVDREVTLTATGTHPAYTVDTWRVTSTPLEEP